MKTPQPRAAASNAGLSLIVLNMFPITPLLDDCWNPRRPTMICETECQGNTQFNMLNRRWKTAGSMDGIQPWFNTLNQQLRSRRSDGFPPTARVVDFASVRIERSMPVAGFCLIAACLLSPPAMRGDDATDGSSISTFNAEVQRDAIAPAFEPTSGYLRAVLEYLRIPTESQIVVFSSASFQAKLINPENPRAIYFNDDVAIAWVRGSSSIEAAAFDPETGTAFFRLEKTAKGKPRFRRDDSCLSCHQSHRTAGVPGLFVLSNPSEISDHRTPLAARWGGWYVTGLSSGFRHLGNRTGQGWLKSLYDQFDTSGYLTEYSDVVALITFEHQTQAANLITRLAREARLAGSRERLNDSVNDLVDYLLFVDEAPLPSRIIGTAGFREKFEGLGPFDRKGRSFRQFDLRRQMMLYPCSYMIYSKAFEALPFAAKRLVYARMRDILTGRLAEPRYARMSRLDRQAILEILRDTKSDWPECCSADSTVKGSIQHIEFRSCLWVSLCLMLGDSGAYDSSAALLQIAAGTCLGAFLMGIFGCGLGARQRTRPGRPAAHSPDRSAG
jgi:hypothetical protein